MKGGAWPRRTSGPKGQDKIARAVGRIENRYKLAKLFDLSVAEDGFNFARNPARIAAEARLDGFYVIRTSVEDKALALAPSSYVPFGVNDMRLSEVKTKV